MEHIFKERLLSIPVLLLLKTGILIEGIWLKMRLSKHHIIRFAVLTLILFAITNVSYANETEERSITVHVFNYGEFDEVTNSHEAEYDIECIIDESVPKEIEILFKLLNCIDNLNYSESVKPREVLEEIDFDIYNTELYFNPEYQVYMGNNSFTTFISDYLYVTFYIDKELSEVILSWPFLVQPEEISNLVDANCNRIVLGVLLRIRVPNSSEMLSVTQEHIIWELSDG